MIEKLKDMTIVSWGAYQYFRENVEKLKDKVKIKYIFANEKYVIDKEKYNILDKKEKILALDNPFIIISQAKISDVENAAKWCKSHDVPFCHLEFLINNSKFGIKYIKAIGGFYRDFNNNTIGVSPEAKGNITIETLEAKNSCVSIGNISVKERLYIKMFGYSAKFRIGNGTTIVSTNVIVNTNGEVEIGKDCMFSHTISLMQSDQHQIFDLYTKKRINYKKDIYIGNHVWMGRECELLAGARIGDNSICGARTTTSGIFPSNVIIAGCPAKIIRKGIIWSRDNIKDKECEHFNECIDKKALKYINENSESVTNRTKESEINHKSSFEDTIIQLYKQGITTKEIAQYIEKHYGNYYVPKQNVQKGNRQ